MLVITQDQTPRQDHRPRYSTYDQPVQGKICAPAKTAPVRRFSILSTEGNENDIANMKSYGSCKASHFYPCLG